ncbi:hypothetical protein I3F58_21435 [Streptomyces sp. MUM 203J]|uniref:hypothetical protein n=1 Tax=Streptomyces sp. MUM 203J TaxID=2791990 RepID=UPI001F04195C|nr:hypothetical protein [Streptomyces sp. MUM 203J]MCH0542076.1 hypothetical protein [Streptomyces sp. MUM 203J]
MEMDESRAAAVRELRMVASKSQRTGNVPFPPDFVIAKEGQDRRPPLARMIQGGQGGSVRLSLYLCITMMATKEPFNLRKPPTPKAWARMLNLDPRKGDRRVQRNLKWLAENDFIKLEPRWGGPAEIRLLSAAGNGREYVRPIEQKENRGRYVGIPAEFWTQGWILELTPTAVALLLVLREALGKQEEPQYIPTDRQRRYGLSPDTWTKANKELQRHGLLTVAREIQGSTYDYDRWRNSYLLDLDRLKEPPEVP